MGLFDKIKNFLRGNKGTGGNDPKENTEPTQTTFNEDGLDVLVEDGLVENVTSADATGDENTNAPEGIGAEGFTPRTSCPGGYNANYMTTGAGGWNTCIVGSPTKSDANVLSNCVG